MISGMQSRDRKVAATILIAVSAVMLFPLVQSWRGRNIPLVQGLGFSPGTIAPGPAWIAALLFAAAYIAYTFRAVPSVREHQREISGFKLIGVVAAFASGIMEEVVFRRWLMDMTMAQGIGDFGQVLVSGVVFGLAHLAWITFSVERRFSFHAAAATTLAGWALAAIYLLAGRNLGPCIAAHTAINLVVEPWLVLAAVSGVQQRAPADS
jgi:membrane protease YdiL (CAAX protease family)